MIKEPRVRVNYGISGSSSALRFNNINIKSKNDHRFEKRHVMAKPFKKYILQAPLVYCSIVVFSPHSQPSLESAFYCSLQRIHGQTKDVSFLFKMRGKRRDSMKVEIEKSQMRRLSVENGALLLCESDKTQFLDISSRDLNLENSAEHSKFVGIKFSWKHGLYLEDYPSVVRSAAQQLKVTTEAKH
ncbi:hypothetical protein WN51_03869 [Melipona quadrifasciata]|uniref:Uncharacterized protein n=1 Tax=Melipona quadrifasciata TaxID=166423 RepID=A0A0M9AAY1_9HYME|nr:hypothetical protein WN51_03869 [Melipona quadrifasciata]